MIHLTLYEISEIVIGLSFLWVSVYLLSKNPTSLLSQIAFLFLFGVGFVMINDPILLQSSNLREYIIWQKITDWPLFFSPVLYYHASVLTSGKMSKAGKLLIIAGYCLAILFYTMDIHGGLILRENIIRWTNYRRFDGFAAGPFLIPSVSAVCLYTALGSSNFIMGMKQNFLKYFMPAMGGVVYFLTAVLVMVSYYVRIAQVDFFFSLGMASGAFLFLFSLVRYHLFSPSEKVFDRSFTYKSISMILIILLYLAGFTIAKLPMSFEALVLLIITLTLILFTHSFYDWLSTFINDFLYNPSAGFSVVNDQEIYLVLRNYHTPERLEESALLRLNILKSKTDQEEKMPPVDALRSIISDAINYFKPEDEPHRRTKKNLKYQLLKMLVFDEAEEGQILWELGFEEYPVKIMAQERKYRSPLFETKSPSDYTYTSRNAFIALKKEAIHDITWRISYLEKLAKKKR